MNKVVKIISIVCFIAALCFVLTRLFIASDFYRKINYENAVEKSNEQKYKKGVSVIGTVTNDDEDYSVGYNTRDKSTIKIYDTYNAYELKIHGQDNCDNFISPNFLLEEILIEYDDGSYNFEYEPIEIECDFLEDTFENTVKSVDDKIQIKLSDYYLYFTEVLTRGFNVEIYSIDSSLVRHKSKSVEAQRTIVTQNETLDVTSKWYGELGDDNTYTLYNMSESKKLVNKYDLNVLQEFKWNYSLESIVVEYIDSNSKVSEIYNNELSNKIELISSINRPDKTNIVSENWEYGIEMITEKDCIQNSKSEVMGLSIDNLNSDYVIQYKFQKPVLVDCNDVDNFLESSGNLIYYLRDDIQLELPIFNLFDVNFITQDGYDYRHMEKEIVIDGVKFVSDHDKILNSWGGMETINYQLYRITENSEQLIYESEKLGFYGHIDFRYDGTYINIQESSGGPEYGTLTKRYVNLAGEDLIEYKQPYPPKYAHIVQYMNNGINYNVVPLFRGECSYDSVDTDILLTGIEIQTEGESREYIMDNAYESECNFWDGSFTNPFINFKEYGANSFKLNINGYEEVNVIMEADEVFPNVVFE